MIGPRVLRRAYQRPGHPMGIPMEYTATRRPPAQFNRQPLHHPRCTLKEGISSRSCTRRLATHVIIFPSPAVMTSTSSHLAQTANVIHQSAVASFANNVPLPTEPLGSACGFTGSGALAYSAPWGSAGGINYAFCTQPQHHNSIGGLSPAEHAPHFSSERHFQWRHLQITNAGLR